METSKTVLGPEHPSTLCSMNNLASTYRNQGRWTEAEKLHVQVMVTRKTVLGPGHPDTLTNCVKFRNQRLGPILILLLLQLNWKHGKGFSNILPYKSRRVRPTSFSRLFQLRYISRTISTAHGAIRSKLSRPHPL
ncbi:hypothetical protein V8E54_010973, partial [Elaphomyces granulatus]